MTRKTVFIPTVGIADVSEYTPTEAEEKLIQEFENLAESDIERERQSTSVTFRWSEFEIKRAKKIASKMGIPYQTYIKMTLKQAMDNDEKKFN